MTYECKKKNSQKLIPSFIIEKLMNSKHFLKVNSIYECAKVCQVVLCHCAASCDLVPCIAMPGAAVPCGAMPGAAVPCGAMPGAAVPCSAMPGAAVPCRAMPGAAVSCCALPGATVPSDAVPCNDI